MLTKPAPAVALEGDFSAWSAYTTLAFPTAVYAGYERFRWSFDEDSMVLVVTYADSTGKYRLWTVNVETGVTIFLSPAGTSYVYDVIDRDSGGSTERDLNFGHSSLRMGCVSMKSKYQLINSLGLDTYILKEGAVQQTLTMPEGYGITTLSMSQSGKYIFYVQYNVAQITVLEGA